MAGERKLSPSRLQNSFFGPMLARVDGDKWLCGFCDISSDGAATKTTSCSAGWQKRGEGARAAQRPVGSGQDLG